MCVYIYRTCGFKTCDEKVPSCFDGSFVVVVKPMILVTFSRRNSWTIRRMWSWGTPFRGCSITILRRCCCCC
ncbi:unnamed protein product [Allacma fusca]|uniref:Uncharacterized protein n=1 Tax=Allacma fusca TaxID=39272 RepID=A0A8J2PXM0_9HEXA|nr:unnamed protein product [Allacma fusca]